MYSVQRYLSSTAAALELQSDHEPLLQSSSANKNGVSNTRGQWTQFCLGMLFMFVISVCFFLLVPAQLHFTEPPSSPLLQRTLISGDSCWGETWDDCICDAISCGDDGDDPACIGSCDTKLKSDSCRMASDNCVQYDARYCGTWCSEQRFQVSSFECSSCRSDECGPFCHGVPSVCKFDLCPASAELCGDSWALTCRSVSNGDIKPAVTQKILGDDDTGFITEMSITLALTKYNDMLKAAGVSCDCEIMPDDTCMEADLCTAVQELADGFTARIETMSGWDSRCCAYCTMVDPSGLCAGAVAHYASALTRTLTDRTEL